ncbi:putative tubulin-specific chaperone Rbl2 [Poronia punctata]|nr:putative tubulin-specific chaperone Rbl2 [Poronia punctata]
MPAPSPLAIATQSVNRLVKEETYYRKELSQQTERVKKLQEKPTGTGSESTDGNEEFMLKQEQKAIEETRAVFAPLRERIDDAVRRLEEQIATAESEDGPAEEIANAKKALELGRAPSSAAA